jgi:hypothetical protein
MRPFGISNRPRLGIAGPDKERACARPGALGRNLSNESNRLKADSKKFLTTVRVA